MTVVKVTEAPYIFVHIPKTAGISIELMMREQKIPYYGHVYARCYPKEYLHKCKTIVRNPYDRAVSAYFFMKRGGFNNAEQYIRLVKRYPTFEDWVLYGLDERYLKHSREHFQMEPCILQSEWLVDDSGEQIIEKENIGRFESLSTDVKRLFNVDLRCHYNVTEHLHWSRYYENTEIKEKIHRLYRRDFELLGYMEKVIMVLEPDTVERQLALLAYKLGKKEYEQAYELAANIWDRCERQEINPRPQQYKELLNTYIFSSLENCLRKPR